MSHCAAKKRELSQSAYKWGEERREVEGEKMGSVKNTNAQNETSSTDLSSRRERRSLKRGKVR